MRSRRWIAAGALLVLALAACTKNTEADPGRDRPNMPDGPVVTGSVPVPEETVSGGTGGGGSEDPGSGEDSGSGDDSGSGGAKDASNDDMKVFGYATSDEAALAAEVAKMSETATTLADQLAGRDVDGAEATAKTLLKQAEQLGDDAGAAEKRQKPLDPSDATLSKARGDAIDAFGLTATYADTVADLANACLSLDLSEIVSAAQRAASLEGTSDDIASAYADLTTELEQWAQANPGAAAAALAKYGTD